MQYDVATAGRRAVVGNGHAGQTNARNRYMIGWEVEVLEEDEHVETQFALTK